MIFVAGAEFQIMSISRHITALLENASYTFLLGKSVAERPPSHARVKTTSDCERGSNDNRCRDSSKKQLAMHALLLPCREDTLSVGTAAELLGGVRKIPKSHCHDRQSNCFSRPSCQLLRQTCAWTGVCEHSDSSVPDDSAQYDIANPGCVCRILT